MAFMFVLPSRNGSRDHGRAARTPSPDCINTALTLHVPGKGLDQALERRGPLVHDLYGNRRQFRPAVARRRMIAVRDQRRTLDPAARVRMRAAQMQMTPLRRIDRARNVTLQNA